MPNLRLFQQSLSTWEDPRGRTEITTDAYDKVLGYRNPDGERYEHKMKVGNLNVDNLKLGSNAQEEMF